MQVSFHFGVFEDWTLTDSGHVEVCGHRPEHQHGAARRSAAAKRYVLDREMDKLREAATQRFGPGMETGERTIYLFDHLEVSIILSVSAVNQRLKTVLPTRLRLACRCGLRWA